MIDGAKLKRLRNAKNMTMTDLAERVGVTPQCIHRAENEMKDFSLPVAAVTAKILGCSIEDFLKPINLGLPK